MAKGIGIKLNYEDWLIVCFLIGTAAGTAAVNLLGPAVQEEAGYMGQLYETAAKMEQGGAGDFFAAVWRQRILEIAVLWFVSLTVFSEKGFYLAALWAGLSSACVLSIMVCQKGVFGPFCYLAAVLPQYVFYIPAWLLAAAAGARYRNRFSLKSALLSIFLTLAGIGCEVWINPVLIRGMDMFV